MRALVLMSVQCLLALTWTIYVHFLPQFAARAGIAAQDVAGMLVMDQVIFVAMDCALGIAADRMADAMRRLGGWILALTLLSCAAFVILPQTASPAVLLGLTALWAATSSALRAPAMVLVARRMQASASARLVGWAFFGTGLAAAVSPLVTVWLRGMSPVLPFAAASLGLLAAVLALRYVEAAPDDADSVPDAVAAPARLAWLFFAAAWALALGFQIHTTVNSAPLYLRFVPADGLLRVMPTFWLGFTLCVLLPSSPALRRVPVSAQLLTASALGAVVLAGFAAAGSLAAVLVLQLAAGGLWGVALGTATNTAIESGHVGREGRYTGLVFALSALAALTRIVLVATGAVRQPALAPLLRWLPAATWGLAALLLAAFVARNLAGWRARLAQRPG